MNQARGSVATVSRLGPVAGAFSPGAVVAFAAAVVGVQWARAELDAVATPLSLYLHGRGGLALRVAYVLLAAALFVQSLACRAEVTPARRSAAAPLLYAAAAAGLVLTAFAAMNPPGGTPTFEGWLHGVGAMTAFLCTTVGALMQVMQLRGGWPVAALWRAAPPAAAAFVALWLHVLMRAWPRGLTQKVTVAFVLLWLAATALGLMRRRA